MNKFKIGDLIAYPATGTSRVWYGTVVAVEETHIKIRFFKPAWLESDDFSRRNKDLDFWNCGEVAKIS